jgi:hypothetical protein
VDGSDAFNHPGDLLSPVAALTREVHELFGLGEYLAMSACPHDRDTATTTKFEQSLGAKDAQRTQDRVLVDANYGGEVARRRQAIPGASFPIGDRPGVSAPLPVDEDRRVRFDRS